MKDDVVDYMGQTNAGYGSTLPSTYFAKNGINFISQGHFLTDPSDVPFVQLGSNMYNREPYSDELANGDSADNRDIHEDEDMNDDVVDFNGATNAGYGSKLPSSYVEHNTINDISAGHFLTDPSFLYLKSQFDAHSIYSL